MLTFAAVRLWPTLLIRMATILLKACPSCEALPTMSKSTVRNSGGSKGMAEVNGRYRMLDLKSAEVRDLVRRVTASKEAYLVPLSLPYGRFSHGGFHVFFMETGAISFKSLKRWWARQGLNL